MSFQTEMVVHSVLEALLASKVTLSRLNGYMTTQELDLFKLASSLRQSLAQVRRRSCGAINPIPHDEAASRTIDQITFGVNPLP